MREVRGVKITDMSVSAPRFAGTLNVMEMDSEGSVSSCSSDGARRGVRGAVKESKHVICLSLSNNIPVERERDVGCGVCLRSTMRFGARGVCGKAAMLMCFIWKGSPSDGRVTSWCGASLLGITWNTRRIG